MTKSEIRNKEQTLNPDITMFYFPIAPMLCVGASNDRSAVLCVSDFALIVSHFDIRISDFRVVE